MTLLVRPIALREANDYVARHHRHHPPTRGHKWSVCARLGDEIVGVAIAGRPLARGFDPAVVLEVLRVCTNGARNACSLLYGSCRQTAKGMGYKKVITYTLASEDGASLRAAGFVAVARVSGRSWSCPSRPRDDKHPLEDKIRWEINFA